MRRIKGGPYLGPISINDELFKTQTIRQLRTYDMPKWKRRLKFRFKAL